MRRMLANREGSAAIEFAASSFVVIAALVALLESATLYFAQGVLEAAVDRAARFASTGSAPAGASREERLLELLSGMSMGMIDTAGVQVRTAAYDGYQAVGEAGAGSAGLGGAGDVLMVEATLDWGGLTPVMRTLVGVVQLGASAVVRAEKFQD